MGARYRSSRAKENVASAKRTRLDSGSIMAQMREVGRQVCGLASFFLHRRLISVQGHMITLWAESCMCVNSALICFRKWFLKRCRISLLLESFHTKQTTPRKMESEAVDVLWARPPFLLESWAHWSGPLPSPRGAGEIWPNLPCGVPFLDPMKCTHAACINLFHTGGRGPRVWRIQTCPVPRAASADTWVHRYVLVLLAEPSRSNLHALRSVLQTDSTLFPTHYFWSRLPLTC